MKQDVHKSRRVSNNVQQADELLKKNRIIGLCLSETLSWTAANEKAFFENVQKEYNRLYATDANTKPLTAPPKGYVMNIVTVLERKLQSSNISALRKQFGRDSLALLGRYYMRREMQRFDEILAIEDTIAQKKKLRQLEKKNSQHVQSISPCPSSNIGHPINDGPDDHATIVAPLRTSSFNKCSSSGTTPEPTSRKRKADGSDASRQMADSVATSSANQTSVTISMHTNFESLKELEEKFDRLDKKISMLAAERRDTDKRLEDKMNKIYELLVNKKHKPE